MDLLINLLKQAPIYYQKINQQDPLVMIILSAQLTALVFLIYFRNKTVVQLLLLAFLLAIVMLSRSLHIQLSMLQPKLLKDKIITLRYFDDEGSFVIYVIALPIFIISMIFSVMLIISILKQIKSVRHNIKQNKTKKHDKEKTKSD